MLFGLTAEDITNIFLAIAALVVALEAAYTKITHGKVKSIESKVDENTDHLARLTNGELKSAVKEAVREERRDL